MRVKRKKKNNKYFIFIVLLLISGISIGYASFSSNLKITGTANANGKFNVEFISSKIIDAKGIDALESVAEISEDKNTLTINIKDMKYPGAGATISAVIQNNGTVPAKLKNITFKGNNDKDISVIFVDSSRIGQTLNVNEMWNIKLIVKWNIDSTIQANKAINFAATLEYEQAVGEYQPST